MAIELVIAISALLQFAAATVAFKLIRVTGKRSSWGLISLAIFLMAIRRSISLIHYVSDNDMTPLDFSFEMVGLLISGLILTGLALITPLFKSMATNILELKKAEEASRRNEKKLDDITSHLAEGIYVLDERGHFSFMNQEAERLTGWTFAEIKGKVVHDTIHYKKNGGSPLPIEECQMLGVIRTGKLYSSTEEIFVKKDGTIFPISVIASPIFENGKIVAAVTAFRNITEQKKLEQERERLIEKLQESLDTIKTLRGILPICASCKMIRDDKGYWNQVEVYIRDHTEAEFSHGICPDCAKKLYPEFFADKDEQEGTERKLTKDNCEVER